MTKTGLEAAGPLTNCKNLRKLFHVSGPRHSNFTEPTKRASLGWVHRRCARDLRPTMNKGGVSTCVCVFILNVRGKHRQPQ